MHIDTTRIIFGLRLHLRRFGSQKPACHTDTVAADIQQRTTAHFRIETDIWRIAPLRIGHPETKGRSDQPGRADGAFGNQLLDAAAAGMKAIHKCFHQQASGIFGNCRHFPGLFGIARQGLFTQHVFAGLKGFNGPGVVKMIRKRNINKIDLRINQQGLITVVNMLYTIISHELFRLSRRASCQGNDVAIAGFADRGNHAFAGNGGVSHNPPFNRISHPAPPGCRLWRPIWQPLPGWPPPVPNAPTAL